MPTNEIPRQQWVTFCNEFSLRHFGESVMVEVFGEILGDQIEAKGLPFEGISADIKVSSPNQPDHISITLGDSKSAHITHTITAPKALRLAAGQENTRDVLEIENDRGVTTLVRFSGSIAPPV